jgi:hypothetical protein
VGWVEDKIEKKIEKVTETVTVEAARTRSELASTFATSLRGERLTGALPRPIRPNAVQYGTAGRLVGWSLRASAADVTVTFHDGRNADADPLATVVVPAGRSDTTAFPGVSFVGELYAEVTTAGGTVTGAVWLGAVD